VVEGARTPSSPLASFHAGLGAGQRLACEQLGEPMRRLMPKAERAFRRHQPSRFSSHVPNPKGGPSIGPLFSSHLPWTIPGSDSPTPCRKFTADQASGRRWDAKARVDELAHSPFGKPLSPRDSVPRPFHGLRKRPQGCAASSNGLWSTAEDIRFLGSTRPRPLGVMVMKLSIVPAGWG